MKNSKIIIGVLSAFLLFSCDKDFLDKQNPEELGEATFYNTEKQLKQAIVGVYGQLQSINSSQWLLQEMVSDNTTIHFNEGDRGQGPNIESVEYWQINSSTGVIYNAYRDIYHAIGNINTVILKLSEADIDQTSKSRFEGEVKFIRAYYYFILAQYFGDVIIIKEPIKDPSEAFQYSRSPVADVYSFIEEDLEFAIASQLPKTVDPSEAGRVSLGAALSLQGKVFLTQKKFEMALKSLNRVIALGEYSLVPNYSDIFDPNNKNNSESIFEIQYQGGNDLGESSGFIYNFYPLFSNGAVIDFPGISGGGWNIPTLDLINTYEVGDLRKDASLREGYINNDGEFVAVPYIQKFHHPHTVQGRPDDNWPVIRYADVLLMAAEAINEQSGPNDLAYSYLNKIRGRAGLDPLNGLGQDQFRNALRKERRLELAFENQRWFDLKRTYSTPDLVNLLNQHGVSERAHPTTSRGQIEFSPGDYQFDALEIFYPIPEREILINPDLE